MSEARREFREVVHTFLVRQVEKSRKKALRDSRRRELWAYLIHDLSCFAGCYAAPDIRNEIPGHETARRVEALAYVRVFRGTPNETWGTKIPIQTNVQVIKAPKKTLGILIREGHSCHLFKGFIRMSLQV